MSAESKLEEQSEEENDIEEYKVHANALKDQANDAFKSGDIQGAITLFTQAIDLDPDNHVFYSNRAAAYMKADSKSKALKDAEKCVELAPTWVKGYNRLGAAQQSLKRFDAAIDTYKKGIELEPNNKSLWEALKVCQEAFGTDKQQRFKHAELERQKEEERLKLRDKVKKEIEEERKKQKQEEKEEEALNSFFSNIESEKSVKKEETDESKPNEGEDDLLADFFNEVAKPVEKEKKTIIKEEGDEKESEKVKEKENKLTEKYVNQDLGDGKSQVERLLSNHYEWKNLNPFNVFQLNIDATEEDIKLRYKKLSLKVHPDRLRSMENARDAFEQVKDAYAKLMDEDKRNNAIYHIETATTEYKKERKKLINKGIKEQDLPDWDEGLQKHIMKHFAEIENMRRRSERNIRAHNAREKQTEKIEEEKMDKLREFDTKWSEDGRRDKRVGNWRDFQTDPEAKKAKVSVSSYKEEKRNEKKHGTVQLETWKKTWK